MHLRIDRHQLAGRPDVRLVATTTRTLSPPRQPRAQEAPNVRSSAVQPGRSPVGQKSPVCGSWS